MDQGDGQTHEAMDAQTPDRCAEVTPADATTTPMNDKPVRGRKRAPVRVESAEPDADEPPAPTADVARANGPNADSADAVIAPTEQPQSKEFPSIADRVEAVILSTDRALSPERIAIALGLIPEDTEPRAHAPSDGPSAKPSRVRRRPQSLVEEALSRVDGAVTELNGIYEKSGRSFRIEAVAGGYRVMTMSRYAPDVARLRNAKVSSKLSRAAIETLAIIAYKQPMTRAELEAIRGVSCGEVLKSLLERRLVTIKGRAEELGRPMLYGTTREFLDHFGLASIKDLPTVEELRASAGV